MDGFINFLISWGDWGMFLASLLSGSICPFISSEAVMIALLAMGVEPWGLLLWGSTGNIIGGVICFYLGGIASPDWLERKLHMNHEKMERATRLTNRHGALAAFFSFIPLVGSAILVVLGMMNANAPKTLTTMSIGKTVRYLLIILPAIGISLLLAK